MRRWWFSLCLALSVAAWISGMAGAQENQAISAIEIKGNTVIPEATIRSAILSAPGKPYNSRIVLEDIARIERLYAGQGYTLARIRDAEMLPDRTLRFVIVEGTVEAVAVIGNRRTRAGAIRDMIEMRPGSVFNERSARRSRERLGDMGIFEQVVLEPVPAETSGKVVLNARVREGRSLFFTGAVGYGRHIGLAGYLDAVETNFLGNAQTVRLQWQRGINASRRDLEDRLEGRSAYQLSFDDPRLLPRRASLGLDLYHKQTQFTPVFSSLNLSPRQFQFREGAAVRIGMALSAHSYARLHLRRDRVHFDDLPDNLLPATERTNSRGTVASLALQGVHQTLDNRTNPRKGYQAAMKAEVGERALGGSFSYTKFTTDLRTLIPLSAGTLELRGMVGIASATTPLSEQYWIGGYDLLRGYDLDEFHGTRAVVATAEYRWGVFPGIQAAVFTDGGYAWQARRDVRVADLRYGGGFGLRFLTPLGPIRLDFAMGRQRAHTYLSLGQDY
jgi:outer membrane protein insertion porin family